MQVFEGMTTPQACAGLSGPRQSGQWVVFHTSLCGARRQRLRLWSRGWLVFSDCVRWSA